MTLTDINGQHVQMGGFTVGMVSRVAVALVFLAYCVKRLLSARYLIEIDERGIFDGATGRGRIPWESIADVSCTMNHDVGIVVLELKGKREKVQIDLDGVEAPIQTVFSSVQDYWQSARDRGLATSNADG